MKVMYPGSFDPVTYGHIDIIDRSARNFDHVIVAVLNNPSKKSMFTIDERIKLLKEVLKDYDNIEVDSFSGLLVNYALEKDCTKIIRGLRAVSDYEYELQMASANKKQVEAIETFFMVSRGEYAFLSSSIVKEIASFGGNISCFVPTEIEKAIQEKIKGEGK